MSFSKRLGYEPEKKALQFESIDEGLRMAIHNAFRVQESLQGLGESNKIYKLIWISVMERDIDEFHKYGISFAVKKTKEHFFSLPWNKVYDYVEFYINHTRFSNPFIQHLNSVFEQHNSAYRFIDKKIVPISNEQELVEVSQATHTGQKAIDTHIKKAVEIFSNRETKDYANTIKEAISAVEAAVNIVNGSEGKTLGDALKQLDKKKKLPETLKIAFEKLYGYTCDKETGIRHAMINEAQSPPDFADAKFMLVTCSAFVNYLLQRNI
ncbi:MAG: hypothetical protein RBS43_00720 [Candidatus Cloacimonas sp.]|jgi:hypothetical protein|nr:hypothetical protein [Candidatus Cloacimonas sp.]